MRLYPSIGSCSLFVDCLLLGQWLPLLIALLAVWRLRLGSLGGRTSLIVAAVFAGVLLAFSVQTFQTGKDVDELSAVRAVWVLPWVMLGRFAQFSIPGFSQRKLAACLSWRGAAAIAVGWVRTRDHRR